MRRGVSLLRKLPKEEVKEQVFRGARGNGGQALNTASNAVRLEHLETGISVRVDATRSLHLNKKIAHERLFDKVQVERDPANSRLLNRLARQKKRNAKQAYRARKKYGAPPTAVTEVKD